MWEGNEKLCFLNVSPLLKHPLIYFKKEGYGPTLLTFSQ